MLTAPAARPVDITEPSTQTTIAPNLETANVVDKATPFHHYSNLVSAQPLLLHDSTLNRPGEPGDFLM